jgi:Ca2+-binding RTX toxin-like protein
VKGVAGNDKLAGLAGDDTLAGGAGNDLLQGGDGDDWLDAGTGLDTADGGAGDDVLRVAGEFSDYVRSRPAATDLLLVNQATGERITVRHVETVHFSDIDIAVAELLADLGGPGNDTLTGTDGDDVLDGGAGSDVLAGGLGDDRYVVNVAGDQVTELAGAGDDVVEIAFTAKGAYVLGDHVEDGIIVSAASLAINLGGNALDNRLAGNGAANVLAGGAGADVLTGGAGKDIFVLDSADGVDTVTDFASGADKLRVSQAAFRVGDGDTKLEDAVVRNAPGGFAPKAELVIFGTNVAGELDAAKAAAAIGSASAAYAAGASALFVVDNGSDSAVFLFASDGDDAAVSAGELTEIVRLVGTSSTVLVDFTFAQ